MLPDPIQNLISALERDKWVRDFHRGAEIVYRSADGRRVTIHFHPDKTCGPGLIKGLLADIGWSEDDMRRVKLIR